MDLFCLIISLENAAKFPFFCRNLSEALITGVDNKAKGDSNLNASPGKKEGTGVQLQHHFLISMGIPQA